MKIYIASSWRNQHAVEMLTALLREKGHIVISFIEQNYAHGFGATKGYSMDEWIASESGQKSFNYDTDAASHSDLIIYISPSGKDAAVELGIAYSNRVLIFGLFAKGEDLGLMRKVVSRWFERYPDMMTEIDKLSQAEL
jgi:hypothetical protein